MQVLKQQLLPTGHPPCTHPSMMEQLTHPVFPRKCGADYFPAIGFCLVSSKEAKILSQSITGGSAGIRERTRPCGPDPAQWRSPRLSATSFLPRSPPCLSLATPVSPRLQECS